ncbi:MAG: N-methylhydantoinase A/acetone carboxylase, beta subunit [Candidatus Methanohalarchaeum thermophilum]|uniref:N-methylhydantoinase A/acetone carboxylase, beta subunit n=1 Tax=Methanohalarchaeum thermophilum TaxID=1903181 RepID=A0A1Q6DX68_METT1|nr:MAG: N-methylhydantoinase A/acetone carboxylase, beta subunit [Candidatus Methanohalarchaeum thermophilum]
MGKIISIDVGGTFTDFVEVGEEIKRYKVPSTPEEPEKAVRKGLKEKKYKEIFHGTTIATNAFLERKGRETAFITNKGFEDLLFIGRQTRENLYSFNVSKPKPPLKKENCFGINCRINEEGKIIKEIDKDEIHNIAKKLQEKNLSAAICLLHSYKNNKQEKNIGEILDKYNIFYSLSHKVSNEFREYERGMTTFFDAYLSPLVDNYMKKVTQIMGREPLIMKSGGGLRRAHSIDPIDTIYSGPAGGVTGGKYISKLLGEENLITFDMGGTSADIATIVDGEITWKPEGKINGFPIQSKMIDIVTVGSGGGSIAWADEGGSLRIGPESAGASPGPVCYGRGGEKPTVTDALLQLGYIDSSYFLGGEMELDVKASKKAIEELSQELGVEFDSTSLGIYRVANSKMARTMKKVTVEKGLDPSDFVLVGFGGAGPLHACSLAEEIGVEEVVIPYSPGVFSAFGMITGDIVQDYAKTVLTDLNNKEKIKKTIKELKDKKEIKGQEKIVLGLRYKGQGYHINLENGEDIEERFHRSHKLKYGYKDTEAEIEVVRVHLEVIKKRDKKYEITNKPNNTREIYKTKECVFPSGKFDTNIFKREELLLGEKEEGPAVILDKNSTTLIPPGWSFNLNENGLIRVFK